MATGARVFGVNRLKKDGEQKLDRDEVARVAYALYEQRGRVDGHDVNDWVKAEGIVRDRTRWGSG